MKAFCGTCLAESPELMVTYLGVKALPPPTPSPRSDKKSSSADNDVKIDHKFRTDHRFSTLCSKNRLR